MLDVNRSKLAREAREEEEKAHTASAKAKEDQMPYEIKPLPCDPTAIRSMSEALIISHYQNNYGGAASCCTDQLG